MISVAEHRGRILSSVHRLPACTATIEDAAGLVLAADVDSAVALPGFTNSAMDGYAVRSADTTHAPLTLPVLGDIPAGRGDRLSMAPGECWRIMTGAALPAGADAIVPVEDTDGGLHRVAISRPAAAGAHIRTQGSDLRAGDRVLRAGTPIGPRQLAVLAAVGRSTVEVVPAPRVVVISTGDELVPIGEPVGYGQVVDSNGPMLVAALVAQGFPARRIAGVSDDAARFRELLDREVEAADAVITTGGVSAGAYDTVKEVLSASGEVRFDSVAMQPGKPQGFGLVGPRAVPVFTLPGNPVSSLVSFVVLVAPALRLMAGRPVEGPELTAHAADGWTPPPGREQYARVVLEGGRAHPVARLSGGQGSHVLGGLAVADALAVVPADVEQVREGDLLRCLPLDATRQSW